MTRGYGWQESEADTRLHFWLRGTPLSAAGGDSDTMCGAPGSPRGWPTGKTTGRCVRCQRRLDALATVVSRGGE